MALPTYLRRLKKLRLVIRQISGDSMLPAYKPGHIVIGRPVGADQLQVGDVVIVRHGGLEKIKRIQQLQQGRVYLIGDNHNSSTDSRSFGWLHVSVITAKVIWPNY